MTWTLDEKMCQTYIHQEVANTLAARDYKQPQAVIYDLPNKDWSPNGKRLSELGTQEARNDMYVTNDFKGGDETKDVRTVVRRITPL